MFENLYAKKSTAPAPKSDAANAAEVSGAENLTYSEVLDRMQRQGKLTADDPRLRLEPARVREFSEMPPRGILSAFHSAIETKLQASTDREERIRYGAALRIEAEHNDLVRGGGATAAIARSTEKIAMRLLRSNAKDATAKDLLSMSAGLTNNAAKERATLGFENGNIAEAAKKQGRTWLSVRDDLVRHNVLDSEDPRRKIRTIDVDAMREARFTRIPDASPEDWEKAAMSKHCSNSTNAKPSIGFAAVAALTDWQVNPDRLPSGRKSAWPQNRKNSQDMVL